MSAIYDNWERLVAAALKKQQFWELCHAPSIYSEAISDSSSSSNSSSSSSQSQKFLPNIVLISDFSPDFDVKDSIFVSEKLLGRGTFGSAYTVTFTNGARIVLKRLKSIVISEEEFRHQMEIVGNIRHENVAALRGYYMSSKDKKYMLYDYYSYGSVFALLHGQTGDVDWETRLRIATGAASGIVEIHAQDGGKFVHGNIRSSNIFLNPHGYGCVSDLGIVNMMAAKLMPDALCYSLEVKNTHEFSQESDVYSFGILLFELLTRKSPIHVPGGPEAVDLVRLVHSVKSKDRTAKVFDANLLGHRAIREQMVKVLKIGISCVAKSPKKRPKMSDVVKMLEDVRMMGEGKLVFVKDSYCTFTLEDVLKAYDLAHPCVKSDEASYRVIALGNGSTFMVKRFRDVNVTYKEFQQHMEIIGKIRHEHVAELRAYCFSNKQVFLVYGYYNKPSLSTLWHGPQWIHRRNIAVGAARGIAHIHNCKLVHGNIKSSNIFLNERGYGLVGGADLAIVLNPTGQQTSGYTAPEVLEDNTNISQASDVYSFGVVLLQLLSRESSQWTLKDDDLLGLVGWIESLSHYQYWNVDPELSGLSCGLNLHDDKPLLQIAMTCVAVDPERRPKIAEVVRILEGISRIDRGDKQSMESRLKDSLGGLLPKMI